MTKTIFDENSEFTYNSNLISSFIQNNILTEGFIERYKYNLSREDWFCIFMYQNLSETFIKKYWYKVNLNTIIQYQKLSEIFIEKHQDKIEQRHWYYISQYQVLTEDFIEKHIYELNLYLISEHQKLSNKFIVKHIDKLNFTALKRNKKIDQELVEKLELLR